MSKVSLRDIAGQLNVSIGLVSAVTNGKEKENRISAEMTKKVRDLAKKLNYQPNHLAKGLRTGRTHKLGVIVADISNPFFAKICREIENSAAKHEYHIVFCSSDEETEKFTTQLNMLKSTKVDGLIICPPAGSEPELHRLEKEQTPVVIIDRYFPEVKFESIIIDNQEASYIAVEHLVKKGYRRIGIINIKSTLQTMRDRTEGYKKALKTLKLKVDKSLIKELPFSHEHFMVDIAIKQLIDAKADAILFTTNKLGEMGLQTFKQLKLAIPQDLAVVSFDDPEFYSLNYTPITAIAQPIEEISQRAVESVMTQIKKGKPSLQRKKIELETKFIIREST